MAFGLPASSVARHDLIASRRVARESILYTFGLLGWKYEMADPDRFYATVALSGMSWGEKVTVSIETPGVLEIRSVCRSPLQLFDWGKNNQNIARFLELFLPKEARDAKLWPMEPAYLDEAGDTPVDRVLKESGELYNRPR